MSRRREPSPDGASATRPAVRPLGHHAIRFVHRLRGEGLRVGTDQAIAFVDALRLVDPLQPEQVRAAARATLVTRAASLPAFEAAFSAFFGLTRRGAPRKAPRAPRHPPRKGPKSALVSFLAASSGPAREEVELPDRTDTSSGEETLRRKDFSKLTPEELRAVERTLREMRWQFAERRSHRLARNHPGRHVDFRQTLRRQLQSGGSVARLPVRGPKTKPRPLVLIADISGSMELYARIFLQFFHGLGQRVPHVESFVFGTRLTRITEALRLKDVDLALAAVTHEVVDFAGGTRIGEALRTFDRRWAGRVLGRGAVVLMVSDGCEHGDVDLLDLQMERLRAKCHRLIWLNPRLSDRRYEPRVKGMQAALRHVDDFLPIGNLDALRGLERHLGRLPRRRSQCRRYISTNQGELSEAQR